MLLTALTVYLLIIYGCFSQSPVDPLATKETKCLYSNLYHLSHSSKQFLFGHHHDNFQGQYFYDKTGLRNESDIKNDTKYFPAFIEYNLDKFLTNNVNFTHHILNAVSKGLMVGWYWLATNPVTGGNSNDVTGNPVTELMPGGTGNKNWTLMLDRFAEFVKTLKLSNGGLIPMIWRPFHECLGDWYWWGMDYCTTTQYIDAYNYTRSYLVDYHGLHNLLFVYAPNKPYSFYGDDADKYLNDRYPGNTNIDIISFDCYDENDFHEELVNNTKLIVSAAQKENKISSIGEFGVKQGLQNTDIATWFMSAFYEPLINDNSAWKIGYVNTWSDFSSTNYWIPLKGQITYNSFIQMLRGILDQKN